MPVSMVNPEAIPLCLVVRRGTMQTKLTPEKKKTKQKNQTTKQNKTNQTFHPFFFIIYLHFQFD